MNKLAVTIAAVTLAFSLAGAANAKQCRDDHGRFMKCPEASGTPHCSKGKPCGHTCISMHDICHR
ncbi:MAG TPA: hypothetical protein VHZ26_11450 [Caulobacteraceae bacterium]|jgi:hypothetical protein|nr:hypothetical protein [Caulobacteraceae bacterium]